AALQKHTVPALETESRYLDKSIGPRFEYNSDRPDGTGHPVKFKAIVKFSCLKCFAHRILKPDEAVDARYYVGELRFVEFEPFQQRHRQILSFASPQVFLVCTEYLFLMSGQFLCYFSKSAVLDFSGACRQLDS